MDYILKYFKTLTGLSITSYINHIRLEKAKELLSNSLDNISEVSMAVGYNSPEYFSRKFKEEFGMSPMEYQDSNA